MPDQSSSTRPSNATFSERLDEIYYQLSPTVTDELRRRVAPNSSLNHPRTRPTSNRLYSHIVATARALYADISPSQSQRSIDGRDTIEARLRWLTATVGDPRTLDEGESWTPAPPSDSLRELIGASTTEAGTLRDAINTAAGSVSRQISGDTDGSLNTQLSQISNSLRGLRDELDRDREGSLANRLRELEVPEPAPPTCPSAIDIAAAVQGCSCAPQEAPQATP